MRNTIVVIQMLTFVGLGLLLLQQGEVRLGAVQWLLALINGLMFWEA